MRVRWGVLWLVLSCAVFGALAPAVGADTGSAVISGTVTDVGTGQPVANIEVDVAGEVGGYHVTCTAADGSYSVSGLLTDTYTVNFSGPSRTCPGSSSDYVSQSFTQAVDSGATTTLNAALKPGGAMSGTVTDRLTGAPLRNVPVVAIPVNPPAFSTQGYGCTGASGGYSMSGLVPGSYVVEFASGGCSSNDSGFVKQYYPDASTQPQATAVTVTADATTTGIDAALDRDTTSPDGMIAGTVINAATGQPAADVPVEADPNPNVGNYAVICTSATGTYLLDSLPPGTTYRVVFAPDDTLPCSGDPFVPSI